MLEDHYTTLNVQFNARTDEIKKSYKKLALKYHPDRKTGDVEKFQEIQKAYEILIDENKRKYYNSRRLEQMHRFARERQKKKIDNRDVYVLVEVDLKAIFRGTSKDIEYNRSVKCNDCNQTGAEYEDGLEICGCCNGKGIIEDTRGSLIMSVRRTVQCDYCEGRGKNIKKGCECKSCNGSLYKVVKQKLTIRIPTSIQNNYKMVYKSKGNGELGDLIVNYRLIMPNNIKRLNHDLIYMQPLNVYDLISFKNKVITHPIDGKISLNLEKNPNLNKLYYVGQLGLFNKYSGRRGKFLIKFNFDYIEDVDEELINFTKKYHKENDYISYNIKEC